MFFGRSDHCHQWFYDGFLCCYHRFQWFSMVPDHQSNDAMVSMDRCGLTPIIASTLLKVFYQQLLVNHPNVTIMHTVLLISIPLLKSYISSTHFFGVWVLFGCAGTYFFLRSFVYSKNIYQIYAPRRHILLSKV